MVGGSPPRAPGHNGLVRVPRLSPARYRVATFTALALLCVIIVTGALVRLTGSGLGCSDWPRCNERDLIDVSSKHAAIEQINRLFTGLVGVIVILAVLGALARVPRRRDLTWLAAAEVFGVIGQAVVGGIVVLTHLNPWVVQLHFLLSMALITDALVLHRRAGSDDLRWRAGRGAAPWVLAGLAAVAIVAGTVVTGAGPHSGNHEGTPIARLPLTPLSAVRAHSAAVLAMLAVTLWLARRARRSGNQRLERALEVLVLAGIGQAVVGYLQYFSGVPVPLVAIHIAGAAVVWLAVVNVVLVAGTWPADHRPDPRRPASRAVPVA